MRAPTACDDTFETKASEVATLYLGYQLHPNTRYNTDLIVDFENAGGRGISQALGLAAKRTSMWCAIRP
jgi:high affinity Mn2+ porin